MFHFPCLQLCQKEASLDYIHHAMLVLLGEELVSKYMEFVALSGLYLEKSFLEPRYSCLGVPFFIRDGFPSQELDRKSAEKGI